MNSGRINSPAAPHLGFSSSSITSTQLETTQNRGQHTTRSNPLHTRSSEQLHPWSNEWLRSYPSNVQARSTEQLPLRASSRLHPRSTQQMYTRSTQQLASSRILENNQHSPSVPVSTPSSSCSSSPGGSVAIKKKARHAPLPPDLTTMTTSGKTSLTDSAVATHNSGVHNNGICRRKEGWLFSWCCFDLLFDDYLSWNLLASCSQCLTFIAPH